MELEEEVINITRYESSEYLPDVDIVTDIDRQRQFDPEREFGCPIYSDITLHGLPSNDTMDKIFCDNLHHLIIREQGDCYNFYKYIDKYIDFSDSRFNYPMRHITIKELNSICVLLMKFTIGEGVARSGSYRKDITIMEMNSISERAVNDVHDFMEIAEEFIELSIWFIIANLTRDLYLNDGEPYMNGIEAETICAYSHDDMLHNPDLTSYHNMNILYEKIYDLYCKARNSDIHWRFELYFILSLFWTLYAMRWPGKSDNPNKFKQHRQPFRFDWNDEATISVNSKPDKNETISNVGQKEEHNMNMENIFEGVFGKVESGMFAVTYNGQVAVKCGNKWKSYNPKKERLTNVTGCVMTNLDSMFFVIPTNKVKAGDLILVDEKPRFVIQNENDKQIQVINYEDSKIDIIIPERHIFMGKTYFYGKIVNLMQNTIGKASGSNSFMKMAMMASMFGSGNGSGCTPFGGLLGGNSGENGNNMLQTMMMYSMFSGMGDDFGFDTMFDGLLDVDDDTPDNELLEEQEQKVQSQPKNRKK